MAQFPQSTGAMTPHEIKVANLRYRTRNFTVALLHEGGAENGYDVPRAWAIYGPWWAYVSRSDAGLANSALTEPYAFYADELEPALEYLYETWDFSVPERYRDKPRAALQALASATDKSAEELGL